MKESKSKTISPAEYMEECRVLAKSAAVSSIYQLWPNGDPRSAERTFTLDFEDAAKCLSRHPGGVLRVAFSWAASGTKGKAEVEYLSASFPTATAKFVWEMIDSLITAKIAQELFKLRYPDPDWLE